MYGKKKLNPYTFFRLVDLQGGIFAFEKEKKYGRPKNRKTKGTGFVMSLVIASVLITGCTGRNQSDSGSLEDSTDVKESVEKSDENTDNRMLEEIS